MWTGHWRTMEGRKGPIVPGYLALLGDLLDWRSGGVGSLEVAREEEQRRVNVRKMRDEMT